MESLGLIVGHMVGDYIVQNDWMAANKGNAFPKQCTYNDGINTPGEGVLEINRWQREHQAWWLGNLACFVHCLCYTLSVWACSFWWMPWWGLLACFAIHFPIDRWRLAGWWMRNVSGQSAFANGPLSPWSIIIVDNTFHLLTLFVIGKVSDGICC